MKKLLMVLVLVVGFAGLAGATLLTDVTTFNSTGTNPNGDLYSYGGRIVDKLEYTGDHVSWYHNFTFDPAYSTINSAKLSLYLYDCDSSYEYGAVYQSGRWTFLGEVDDKIYGAFNVDVNLVKDGDLYVSLISTFGDFYIKWSKLEIDYVATQPVPEPATLLLLGIGMIGVVGAHSRKKLFN
jgi:hypothetical protein